MIDKDIFGDDFIKNEVKIEDDNTVETNLLKKYPVSENFKKLLPKYKKKFLTSYSRVGT